MCITGLTPSSVEAATRPPLQQMATVQSDDRDGRVGSHCKPGSGKAEGGAKVWFRIRDVDFFLGSQQDFKKDIL